MKTIILILSTLIAFSCCSPIDSVEDYSTPQKEPIVEEPKNPIQLEMVYDYTDEESNNYSYIEMYRFELNGMTYVHVQEDNGDGYGYVINVTKDSLMCAKLAENRSVGTSNPTSEPVHNENWYNN